MRSLTASPTRDERVTPTGSRSGGRRPLVLPEGVSELLKWIALVLMTADHVNKFVYDERLPFVFAAGRVSMPLFGFVLAHNLARPGVLASGAYRRTLQRLVLWGAISTPIFVALVGWWPLNILWMLALSTAVCWLIERGSLVDIAGAVSLFVVAGAFVEFWWPAVAMCVAAWAFCKRPNGLTFASILLSLVALWGVNRNYWALASVPLVWLVAGSGLRVPGPRVRLFFYAYYPLHLLVLWMARRWLEPL